MFSPHLFYMMGGHQFSIRGDKGGFSLYSSLNTIFQACEGLSILRSWVRMEADNLSGVREFLWGLYWKGMPDFLRAFLRGLYSSSVWLQTLCSMILLMRTLSRFIFILYEIILVLHFLSSTMSHEKIESFNVKQEQQVVITQPYRSRKVRFWLLLLLSLVIFGNQYAFNNPQAIEKSIEKDLNIKQTSYDLLYTAFSLPNVFATFFLGYFIDYMGVRTGLVSLAVGITLSQVVITIGGYSHNYMTMLVGRILFGIASESLVTAQASMVSFWFKGKELALALGIAVTFPELGNALNSWLTPLFYQASGNLGFPFLVSVLVCTMSLVCAVAAAWLDRKADLEDEASKVRELVDEDGEEDETIKWEDVSKLKRSFWLIVTLCMCAISLYVPFMDNANSLYQVRFCFSQISSGKALVITYIVSSVCSAPLGLFIDKVGYKRYFIILAFSIFFTAQLIIYFFPQCSLEQQNSSIIGLIFVGLGYCFYGNCILPSVALVVKKKVTGTAFGIMQMLESASSAILPLISGAIVENAPNSISGYQRYSLLFLVIGAVGLMLSFGLFFVEEEVKHKLDRSIKEEEERQFERIEVQKLDQAISHFVLSREGSEVQKNEEVEVVSMIDQYP